MKKKIISLIVCGLLLTACGGNSYKNTNLFTTSKVYIYTSIHITSKKITFLYS